MGGVADHCGCSWRWQDHRRPDSVRSAQSPPQGLASIKTPKLGLAGAVGWLARPGHVALTAWIGPLSAQTAVRTASQPSCPLGLGFPQPRRQPHPPVAIWEGRTQIFLLLGLLLLLQPFAGSAGRAVISGLRLRPDLSVLQRPRWVCGWLKHRTFFWTTPKLIHDNPRGTLCPPATHGALPLPTH